MSKDKHDEPGQISAVRAIPLNVGGIIRWGGDEFFKSPTTGRELMLERKAIKRKRAKKGKPDWRRKIARRTGEDK